MIHLFGKLSLERAKVAFCQVPVQMSSCFTLAEGKLIMFYCISQRIKINTVARFSLCPPYQVESSGGPPGSSGYGSFTQSSRRERRLRSVCAGVERGSARVRTWQQITETGDTGIVELHVPPPPHLTSHHLSDLCFGEYLDFGDPGSVSASASN